MSKLELEQNSANRERLGDFIPKAKRGTAEGFQAEKSQCSFINDPANCSMSSEKPMLCIQPPLTLGRLVI